MGNDAMAAGKQLKELREKSAIARKTLKQAQYSVQEKQAAVKAAQLNANKAVALDDTKLAETKDMIVANNNELRLSVAKKEAAAEARLTVDMKDVEQADRAERAVEARKAQLLNEKIAADQTVSSDDLKMHNLQKVQMNEDTEMRLMSAEARLSAKQAVAEADQAAKMRLAHKQKAMELLLKKETGKLTKEEYERKSKADLEQQRVDIAAEKMAKVSEKKSKANSELSVAKSSLSESESQETTAKSVKARLTADAKMDQAAKTSANEVRAKTKTALQYKNQKAKEEIAAKTSVHMWRAKASESNVMEKEANAKKTVASTKSEKYDAGQAVVAAATATSDSENGLRKATKTLEKVNSDLSSANKDYAVMKHNAAFAAKRASVAGNTAEELRNAKKLERNSEAAIASAKSRVYSDTSHLTREEALAHKAIASKIKAETEADKAKLEGDEAISEEQAVQKSEQDRLDAVNRAMDKKRSEEIAAAKQAQAVGLSVGQLEVSVKAKANAGTGAKLAALKKSFLSAEKSDEELTKEYEETSNEELADQQVAARKARKLQREKQRVQTEKRLMLTEKEAEARQEQRTKAEITEQKAESEKQGKVARKERSEELMRKKKIVAAKEASDEQYTKLQNTVASDTQKLRDAKAKTIDAVRASSVQKAIALKMALQVRDKQKSLNEATTLLEKAKSAFREASDKTKMQKEKLDDIETMLVKAKSQHKMAAEELQSTRQELAQAQQNDADLMATERKATAGLEKAKKDLTEKSTTKQLAQESMQSALSKCAFNSRRLLQAEAAADCPGAQIAKKALDKATTEFKEVLLEMKEIEKEAKTATADVDKPM